MPRKHWHVARAPVSCRRLHGQKACPHGHNNTAARTAGDPSRGGLALDLEFGAHLLESFFGVGAEMSDRENGLVLEANGDTA